MVDFLKQYGELPVTYMADIGNLKGEENNIEARSSQTGQTGFAQVASAMTSTPSHVVTGPLEEHYISQGKLRSQQPVGTSGKSNKTKSRKIVNLNRWQVKFDGSGKYLTIVSFISRIEILRGQNQLSCDELFPKFHCLVTGSANKWY